jgi:hypothetical protein
MTCQTHFYVTLGQISKDANEDEQYLVEEGYFPMVATAIT